MLSSGYFSIEFCGFCYLVLFGTSSFISLVGQLAVGTLANLTSTPTALVTSCSLGLICIGLIARRYPSLRASM
jgi:hypothetical protein